MAPFTSPLPSAFSAFWQDVKALRNTSAASPPVSANAGDTARPRKASMERAFGRIGLGKSGREYKICLQCAISSLASEMPPSNRPKTRHFQPAAWLTASSLEAFREAGTDAHRVCSHREAWIERFGGDALLSY